MAKYDYSFKTLLLSFGAAYGVYLIFEQFKKPKVISDFPKGKIINDDPAVLFCNSLGNDVYKRDYGNACVFYDGSEMNVNDLYNAKNLPKIDKDLIIICEPGACNKKIPDALKEYIKIRGGEFKYYYGEDIKKSNNNEILIYVNHVAFDYRWIGEGQKQPKPLAYKNYLDSDYLVPSFGNLILLLEEIF